MCNLLNLLFEVSTVLFSFPFLFSGFCCFSVYPNVDIVAMGFSNMSFFAFFGLFLTSKESSILVTPLLLDIENFSMSSFECKALCIIIDFLLFWSIWLSSFHFKNGPEYFVKFIAQVIIPLMLFLWQNLVLRSYLVLQKYSFHTFSLFLFYDVCFQFSVFLIIFFIFPSVLMLSWFCSSVPCINSFLLFFPLSIAYFLVSNSSSMSWLHILIVYNWVSCSFSFYFWLISWYHRYTWDDLSFLVIL